MNPIPVAAEPLRPYTDRSTRNTHTPGPWHTGGIFTPHPGEEYVDVWGPIPAGCQSGDQVCQRATAADARLIAAAPELMEALRLAVHAMRAPIDGWKGEVERLALDKANAAIAKATGGSFAGSGFALRH